MYELCAPVFCCSAGHTVGDHVGKTWFRISLHNKSSKKSAFQSTMEHLTYLDIMDTFALTLKYHKGLSILKKYPGKPMGLHEFFHLQL